MTSLAPTDERTYRFAPLDRTGWILGLGGGQCLALGAGIFAAGFLLQAPPAAPLVIGPVLGAVAFAFGAWDGRAGPGLRSGRRLLVSTTRSGSSHSTARMLQNAMRGLHMTRSSPKPGRWPFDTRCSSPSRSTPGGCEDGEAATARRKRLAMCCSK